MEDNYLYEKMIALSIYIGKINFTGRFALCGGELSVQRTGEISGAGANIKG